MLNTFVTRKFGNVERNSHCDVLHITPIRVARLFLDCNGDFAIKAYSNCYVLLIDDTNRKVLTSLPSKHCFFPSHVKSFGTHLEQAINTLVIPRNNKTIRENVCAQVTA